MESTEKDASVFLEAMEAETTHDEDIEEQTTVEAEPDQQAVVPFSFSAAPEEFVMQCDHDPFTEGSRDKPSFGETPGNVQKVTESPADTSTADIPSSCDEVAMYRQLSNLVSKEIVLQYTDEDSQEKIETKKQEHKAITEGRRDALRQLHAITVKTATAEAWAATRRMKEIWDTRTPGDFRFEVDLTFLHVADVKEEEVKAHDTALRQGRELISSADAETQKVRDRIDGQKKELTDIKGLEDHLAAKRDEQRRRIIAAEETDGVDQEIRDAISRIARAKEKNKKLEGIIGVLTDHAADLEKIKASMLNILDHVSMVNRSLHAFLVAREVNEASTAFSHVLARFVELQKKDPGKGYVAFPRPIRESSFVLPKLEGYRFHIDDRGSIMQDPEITSTTLLCHERL